MAEPTEEEVLEEEEVVEDEEEEKEEVVPVRNVINAQRRIIEKQQKQLGKKEEVKEEDEEELTPQARKLIESEVAKRIAPLNDEIAFRDYFSEHPEDKKYQKAARARFDTWKTVPIEEVMKTLRNTVSAEERDKAVEKATKASIKGGTVRKSEEAVATTEKDMQEVYRQVKRGNTGDALKRLGVMK